MSKRFVYVLTNDESPPKYYTGLTSDVARRCAEHNAGSCTHTAKHRPWSVDVVIKFADERRADTHTELRSVAITQLPLPQNRNY